MSKKSSSQHVGGQGTLAERRKRMQKDQAADVDAMLAEALRSQARELARKYSITGVRVLRRLMLSKNTPANIRRLCALDLINLGEPPNHAGGARAQKLPSGGLTIVVANRPGQLPAEVPVRAMPVPERPALEPVAGDDLDPDEILEAEIA